MIRVCHASPRPTAPDWAFPASGLDALLRSSLLGALAPWMSQFRTGCTIGIIPWPLFAMNHPFFIDRSRPCCRTRRVDRCVPRGWCVYLPPTSTHNR